MFVITTGTQVRNLQRVVVGTEPVLLHEEYTIRRPITLADKHVAVEGSVAIVTDGDHMFECDASSLVCIPSVKGAVLLQVAALLSAEHDAASNAAVARYIKTQPRQQQQHKPALRISKGQRPADAPNCIKCNGTGEWHGSTGGHGACSACSGSGWQTPLELARHLKWVADHTPVASV